MNWQSQNSTECVVPAKAGIQLFQGLLDPGFRRGDDPNDFLRDHETSRPFEKYLQQEKILDRPKR
jgi:hypothetical protein